MSLCLCVSNTTLLAQTIAREDYRIRCTIVHMISSNLTNVTWRTVLWILWALWWGGLSFYAIIVVPTGSEQIGSVAQGFITQRVTYWHNPLGAIMTIALAVEAYRTSSRGLYALSAGIGIVTLLLFIGHEILSSQMNFKESSVSESFYSQHARYLWLTTAQWLLGLFVPVALQDAQIVVPRLVSKT